MKTKRFFSAVLIVTMLFSVFTFTAMAADDITVMLNGTELTFDVPAQIIDDRTMVPMRKIFEALGAVVEWDGDTKTITANTDDIVIVMQIDNVVMSVNEKEITLDVPPQLVDDRTLVPVRAVAEGLDAEVQWDGDTRTVIITKEEVTEDDTTLPEDDDTTPPETEDDTDADSDGDMPYDALTAADMDALKKSYNNLIRYTFEQRVLPMYMLTDNADIVKEIKLKSDNAKNFVRAIWDLVVISRIMEIQEKSETTYLIPNELDDEVIGAYMAIVEDAGLEANNYFDVSFETLKDKSVMMLVTFEKTDTLLACKFLGVVVKSDNSVRYFTAETDLMDKEHLYFCEVTTSGRGTLGLMGFEKSDFINAANTVLGKK